MGAMIRVGGKKMVAEIFRHDTSRNLDLQVHTHCVISNVVQSDDARGHDIGGPDQCGCHLQQKVLSIVDCGLYWIVGASISLERW